MLKPAILYKDELEKKFAEYVYTEDYFYYCGYAYCHELPEIRTKDNEFQWAIVGGDGEVLGYLAYSIDPLTDSVYHFGLFSFKRCSVTVGRDLAAEMERLAESHRRLEWRMIGGNPVKKHYDRFCKEHGGSVFMLHDVTRDLNGGLRNEYVYEVVNDKV